MEEEPIIHSPSATISNAFTILENAKRKFQLENNFVAAISCIERKLILLRTEYGTLHRNNVISSTVEELTLACNKAAMIFLKDGKCSYAAA